METSNPIVTPQLLQDAYLLKREGAIAKVNAVLDGTIGELCIRTRYPKEVNAFVAACLSKRGELENGAGERCFFVRDREAWMKLCAEPSGTKILVAHPELDVEGMRDELLREAHAAHHAVIYSATNPRPDTAEIVDLNEPLEHEVQELLQRHHHPNAERLSQRSNGNIYLLTQLLAGTSERREWAAKDVGYRLRCMALLGGWDDASEGDRLALTELLGEPYETWVQYLYPITREDEPPVLLEGRLFRPVSRNETWQQLGYHLIDTDLERFQAVAIKVLGETEPVLELPKSERRGGVLREKPPIYSKELRKGIAETIALLGGQGKALNTSPTLAAYTADFVVRSLLTGASWKVWASLSRLLPFLAEASPAVFLNSLDGALKDLSASPIRELFDPTTDILFGRQYHCGVLWALEVLAWNPEYLNRTCVCLTRLSHFKLGPNIGNTPAATLRSIFLPWLPQTAATVKARRVAVEKVIEEDTEVGWALLLAILPEAHQVGHHNQRPVWRDWIPSGWAEGVTRSEMHNQVQNYAEIAVQNALGDLGKLTELVSRWDNLPSEVFQEVLRILGSPKIKERPEAERFALWQKLKDEVDRHRKFSTSDWAMPEEEVKKLESAADELKPELPSILYQRLFNHYEDAFYMTDDYDAERKKLEMERERAVLEIIKREGMEKILDVAARVKLPREFGYALGRVGNADIDSLLLPGRLEVDEPAMVDLIKGFVWARFVKEPFEWVENHPMAKWTAPQKAAFFAILPFCRKVWQHATTVLGTEVHEYWRRLRPNPYEAKEDLPEAVAAALENGRPDIAVACVHSLIYLKTPFATGSAMKALTMLVSTGLADRVSAHDVVEIIQYLQKAPGIDTLGMEAIENIYLKWLDRLNDVSPKFLELRLARDPTYFHSAITTCFRSDKKPVASEELDTTQRKQAEHIYSLLFRWQTPPGTTTTGMVDVGLLTEWIQEARRLCEESGHWAVAQQTIGHTFAFPPAGLEGMLTNQSLAMVLDGPDYDEMRIGFRIALFNNRGVHTFTAGKDELRLDKIYREYAEKYDLAKFARIASTLRELADSYQRDAEREAKRNPFGS